MNMKDLIETCTRAVGTLFVKQAKKQNKKRPKTKKTRSHFSSRCLNNQLRSRCLNSQLCALGVVRLLFVAVLKGGSADARASLHSKKKKRLLIPFERNCVKSILPSFTQTFHPSTKM